MAKKEEKEEEEDLPELKKEPYKPGSENTEITGKRPAGKRPIKGEIFKSFLITFILVFAGLYAIFLYDTPQGITGYQVDEEYLSSMAAEDAPAAETSKGLSETWAPVSLLGEVRGFANSLPLLKYAGDGAEICLLINFGNNRVKTFDIFKDNGIIEVAESRYSIYCNNNPSNTGSEDFVISYVDYESFKDNVNDPTCEKFKNNANGKDFYFFPSEFVLQGGKPVCNRLFQVRYCPVAQQCLRNIEMKKLGLDCCMQKTGLYLIPGYGTWQFWLSLGLFVLILFSLVFIVVHIRHQEEQKEKKEAKYYAAQVEDYVLTGRRTGHADDEIRKKLLDSGWDDAFISPIFESLRFKR